MSLTASRELIDSREWKWKQVRKCKIRRCNPRMATQNKHTQCTLYSMSIGKSWKNQAHNIGNSKDNGATAIHPLHKFSVLIMLLWKHKY